MPAVKVDSEVFFDDETAYFLNAIHLPTSNSHDIVCAMLVSGRQVSFQIDVGSTANILPSKFL